MKHALLIALIPLMVSITPHTTHTDQEQNYHRYFWANYHQAAGNYEKAYDWYKMLLDGSSSIYTHKGYVQFLYQTGNFSPIAQLMPKLTTTFQDDPDVQLIFAQSLKMSGRTNEADELFVNLSRKFKDNTEIVFHAADAFSRRQEPENAIATIDTYLNCSTRKTNNFIFHFIKAQIYSQINNPTKALKSVKQCLEMYNQFDKGWLLLAALQEQEGKLSDAIKGYTTYLELTNDNKNEVQKHLIELTLQQKSIEQQTNVLLFNKTCFEKCMILFERKQYEQALQQVDICLKEKPNNTEGQLLKIQILTAMDKFEQACKVLCSWIEQNPAHNFWYQTLHLLSYTGASYDLLIKTLENIHQKHPKEILPVLYLADLTAQAHYYQKTITYHEKALSLTKDPVLKTKIHFHLGLGYYEHNEFDKMKTTLEMGHALKNNFPPLDNLLAYYYATKGGNLQQAETLVTEALKNDPENPHFLDTKAIILFKRKEYKKALSLLTQLAEQISDDAMILIHMAKTEYKLGNKNEALSTIEKAKIYTHNTYEKQTVDKLINQWNM